MAALPPELYRVKICLQAVPRLLRALEAAPGLPLERELALEISKELRFMRTNCGMGQSLQGQTFEEISDSWEDFLERTR